MKHIKKEGKFICKVCGEEFKQSFTLKNHYVRNHSKSELEEKRVPTHPIIHYSRRLNGKLAEEKTLRTEVANERRDALP